MRYTKLAARLTTSDTTINMIGLLVSAIPPLLAIPVLSRLFTPSEYGLFGAAFAVAAVASSFTTGRFETAIVVPDSDRVAAALMASGAMISLLFVLITSALAICAQIIVGLPVNLWVILWSILVASLTALMQVAINGAIRERKFRVLATSRIIGALAQAGLSIGAGLLQLGAAGLLAALVVSYCATIATIMFALSKHYRQVAHGMSFREIRDAAVEYRQYPLMNVPSTLANALAGNLPSMFFVAAYGPTTAGHLAMMFRVWSGTNVLSKGLGEIFRHRAAFERRNSGQFAISFRATAVPLSAVAAVIGLILLAWGPELFEKALGSEWRTAGDFARIMAPFLCLQLVASTMSWAFYISQRLSLLMSWQLSLLVVQLLVLWVATQLWPPSISLICLSATGFFMYAIYLAMSGSVARAQTGTFRRK